MECVGFFVWLSHDVYMYPIRVSTTALKFANAHMLIMVV